MYKHLKYSDCCQFKSKAILWEAALMLPRNEARLAGSFVPWPLCLPTGVPWAHLGALWASVSCCMVGKMMPGLFLIRVKWNHKWTTLTNRTFRRNVKGFLLLTHMPTPMFELVGSSHPPLLGVSEEESERKDLKEGISWGYIGTMDPVLHYLVWSACLGLLRKL